MKLIVATVVAALWLVVPHVSQAHEVDRRDLVNLCAQLTSQLNEIGIQVCAIKCAQDKECWKKCHSLVTGNLTCPRIWERSLRERKE